MGRHKNRVRKDVDSYDEWRNNHEGYDEGSSDLFGDTASPFYVEPLSPLLEDVYERLETLYYTGKFKGRQKQIVTLLLEGETNKTIIAKQLNMNRLNVYTELKKIREKISRVSVV